MATDCIFCKIASGELPSEKIYEDEATVAFLDLKPVNPGHALVIPKLHYRNVFDIPEDAWLAVMKTARHIAAAIQKATSAGGVNIVVNNESPAHQLIFHAHVHVIPRRAGDAHKAWVGAAYEEGGMVKTGDAVRKELSAK
ncbi:MAG: HIT family protein [Patescibacteria group bacterium]